MMYYSVRFITFTIMLSFLKSKISAFYTSFVSKITAFFSHDRSIDDAFFSELEAILLGADVGIKKTEEFISFLRSQAQSGATVGDLKVALQERMRQDLELYQKEAFDPRVILVVGINGVGKTSFIGKYAKSLTDAGKRVLIVGADTFRAAAVEQLEAWALRSGATFFARSGEQDPAAVVFDGCKKFKQEGFDCVIIDTAGRLQSKVNLIKELEKIHRVVKKTLDSESLATWLVVDGVLGQNSLEQARVFNQATLLDGIVVTKLDGTAKGGILFAIVQELSKPVLYVSYGESINDISPFDPARFVKGIFGE